MMKTINWKTATDAEKNACFGKQVCGYMAYVTTEGEAVADFPTGVEDSGVCEVQTEGLPDYLHSADAVLPWLEKQGWKGTSNRCGDTVAATISVVSCNGEILVQRDWTQTQSCFCEAAMIALLRAKGVEVVT
jgi:hypothetical protein